MACVIPIYLKIRFTMGFLLNSLLIRALTFRVESVKLRVILPFLVERYVHLVRDLIEPLYLLQLVGCKLTGNKSKVYGIAG